MYLIISGNKFPLSLKVNFLQKDMVLKLRYLTGVIYFSCFVSFAQQNSSVSIGKDQPQDNAVLLLFSPGHNQGLIIPIADRAQISSPGAGMVVFDELDQALYYHDGTNWVNVNNAGGLSNLKLELVGN